MNNLSVRDLFVGGKYVRQGGLGTRTITDLRGDDVFWEDEVAPGRCSKETFIRRMAEFAPDCPPRPVAVPRKAKNVTKAVLGELGVLVPPLRGLLALTHGLPQRIEEAGVITGFGLGLVATRMSAKVLLEGIVGLGSEPKNKLRVITRAEANAGLLLRSLNLLISEGDLPAFLSGEHKTQLSKALADAQQSAARIQSLLASCLGQ